MFFSCSTPNLATVIPAMDIIDKKLTTDSLNRSKFEAPIRAALGLAKKTLNRYYNLTDSVEVYRITMGTYFMYFLYLNTLIYVITQCYTLDTSSNISRMPAGRMSGSTLRSTSFVTSMSAHMRDLRRRMMKGLATKMEST
jgi:hypothetical protein